MATAKDLQDSLKRLDKMIKETQTVRKKWQKLEKTVKLNKAHEDTILMDIKEFSELLRNYKDTWVLLEKVSETVDQSVSQSTQVLDQKRKLESTSTGRRQRTRHSEAARAHADFEPLPVGTKVCALTPGNRRDDPVWIYASVVSYFPGKHKYEVMDEDEGEDGEPPKEYMLSVKSVVELPESSDYDPGDLVLAMFPQTTSFYPATVVKKTREFYEVRFEDDADETGRTPARRVLQRHCVEMPNMGR